MQSGVTCMGPSVPFEGQILLSDLVAPVTARARTADSLFSWVGASIESSRGNWPEVWQTQHCCDDIWSKSWNGVFENLSQVTFVLYIFVLDTPELLLNHEAPFLFSPYWLILAIILHSFFPSAIKNYISSPISLIAMFDRVCSSGRASPNSTIISRYRNSSYRKEQPTRTRCFGTKVHRPPTACQIWTWFSKLEGLLYPF